MIYLEKLAIKLNQICHDTKFLKILFLFQCLILLIYTRSTHYLDYYADVGDEPSYILFDFSSLKTILGGHRTFGLPLVLRVFYSFFHSYVYWPCFQICVYILSIFILLTCLFKADYNKLLALIFCSIILWYRNMIQYFPFILTEPLAASLVNVTLGVIVLNFYRPTYLRYTLIGVLSLLMPVVRPSLAYVSLVLPIWFLILEVCSGFSLRKIQFRPTLKLAVFAWTPLIILCGVRLLVLGQLGVVSMAGGLLSGHAGYYLAEHDIPALPEDLRSFAQKILERKSHLSPPCNETPVDEGVFGIRRGVTIHEECFGPILMTTWSEAIYEAKNQLPVVEVEKNWEPWKFVRTLSGYHNLYDYQIDARLAYYSKAVLKVHSLEHQHWFIYASLDALTLFYNGLKHWIPFLSFLLGIACLAKLACYRLSIQKLPADRKIVGLFLISCSYFVFGFPSTIYFNTIHFRFFELMGIYIIPAIVILLIPVNSLSSLYERRLKKRLFSRSQD